MSSDRLALVAKVAVMRTLRELKRHTSDAHMRKIADEAVAEVAALTEQPDAAAPAIPRPDCELLSSPESLLAFDDELNPEPDEPTRELPPVAPPAQVSEEQVRQTALEDAAREVTAERVADNGTLIGFSAQARAEAIQDHIRALLRSPASTRGKEPL